MRQRPRLVRLALPFLFILFALSTCLVLALSVPTGEVPDEPAHILRADSLLHGELLGRRRPTWDFEGDTVTGAGVVANRALLAASTGEFPPGSTTLANDKKLSAATLARLHAIPWDRKARFIFAPNVAVYMPVLYAPVAAAFGIARVMGIAPHAAILLGRIANALCFTIVGALALLLARRGRGILFTALSLPMTLSLAASCSEDGLLIATSVLAAALLTRCRDAAGRAYWGAGALLACVVAVKIPYLPLAAAMAVPCCHAVGRLRRRALAAGVALVALPGLAWNAVAMALVAAPFVRGPAYHPGPLWPGDPARLFHATDPAAQLRVLWHDPALVLGLPLHAVWSEQSFYRLREMVGVLGWVDVLLPDWLYALWYVALILAIVADLLGDEIPRPGRQALAGAIGVGAVLLAALAIYDAQYLSWTLVGAADIEGVQGRYGTPLLAMLAAAVPAVRLLRWQAVTAAVRAALLLPAVAAAATGVAVVPQVVLLTYYLR